VPAGSIHRNTEPPGTLVPGIFIHTWDKKTHSSHSQHMDSENTNLGRTLRDRTCNTSQAGCTVHGPQFSVCIHHAHIHHMGTTWHLNMQPSLWAQRVDIQHNTWMNDTRHTDAIHKPTTNEHDIRHIIQPMDVAYRHTDQHMNNTNTPDLGAQRTQ
jgi:hypothetical protein